MQDEAQLGIKKESSEHPSLPPEVIQVLVRDHLQIDPAYYSKEAGEQAEESEEDSEESRSEGGDKVSQMVNFLKEAQGGGKE